MARNELFCIRKNKEYYHFYHAPFLVEMCKFSKDDEIVKVAITEDLQDGMEIYYCYKDEHGEYKSVYPSDIHVKLAIDFNPDIEIIKVNVIDMGLVS